MTLEERIRSGKLYFCTAPGFAEEQERCLELLLRALELTGRDSVLSQNYGPSLSQSIQGVRALLAADSWDGVYRALPPPLPL